jgi:type I restriction enzyme M protein
VSGATKLSQYDLAHKWKQDKKTEEWEKGKLSEKEAPQILFIERCMQFLRFGGRMAIVLPDGIFGNNQLGYIRRFIMKQARLVAVIDIPLETFMPNTGTKTSILILQKLKSKQIPEDYPVFMCVAETCGHDRRGNIKEEDDISHISEEFKKWANENNFSFTQNGK